MKENNKVIFILYFYSNASIHMWTNTVENAVSDLTNVVHAIVHSNSLSLYNTKYLSTPGTLAC
jgi:hypothetical protein